MARHFYDDTISNFLTSPSSNILGILAANNEFDLSQTQRDSWTQQLKILKQSLSRYDGHIFFEYSIPRMGKRIDAVVIIKNVLFVIEFKVGEKHFSNQAKDQVWDYALDLKNFHEASHDKFIAPILIATEAKNVYSVVEFTPQEDNLLMPIFAAASNLTEVIGKVLELSSGEEINHSNWKDSRYSPTPTIIEAATALYRGHSVKEISRSDAGAINLSDTSDTVKDIISQAKERSQKCICFVTGVPGAGKTLVGLNIATMRGNDPKEPPCVFLSGNGPLVKVLREALAQDKVARSVALGEKVPITRARSEVQAFIQNIHHFRDDCLTQPGIPPVEHVAIFDEAQRAWNLEQTVKFMKQKKGRPNFGQSEPEFLISCLDRHSDWAVILCLVGGGQEINTGEAGISEWIEALGRSFPEWKTYISPRLIDSEYGAGKVLKKLEGRKGVNYSESLHLGVSMRSFRAEHVSQFVKQLLDCEPEKAKDTLIQISRKYPIVLTRCLKKAKTWLKTQARGSERYGIVVSSQAERLRPHAIHVKSPIDAAHWFLKGKEDVRSSYYLEDVATEFHVQGLELDWTCVTWDGDFCYRGNSWKYRSFKGNKWQQIKQEAKQRYLKNAYRVLLTRARQGMVIVIPEGDLSDPTRLPEFYDSTFEYLYEVGLRVV
jgi:hypothetical protein